MAGNASNLDLLNLFWKDLHNQKTWRDYTGPARRMAQDVYARYRQVLAQARPFNIDDRALKIAYKLSLEPAEVVARRLMLARLPFPKTWIEFDFRTKLALSEANGTSHSIVPGTPYRIGYLLEEDPRDPTIWAVSTIIQPDEHSRPRPADVETEISCITWMVDTQNRRPPIQVGSFKSIPAELCKGMVRDDLDLDDKGYPSIRHLGWGYLTADGESQAKARGYSRMAVMAVPEPLVNSINIGVTPLIQNMVDARTVSDRRFKEVVLANAVESRGDVRIIVALLSLINEVPIIKEHRKPAGKIHLSGSFRPFLQNSIVKIDIPSKRYMTVVRKLIKNAQERVVARHEVRGHFRTIIHKHAHERVRRLPDGTIERQWIHDGELEKVWVKSHERGDASVGYVKHKYVVEKNASTGTPQL